MSAEKLFEFIDDHVGLQLASVALLGLATIPIYIGSFTSLSGMKHPTTAVKIKRKATRSNPLEDSDDDEGEEKSQVLNIKDILFIPIVSSIVLYSLHLALKEVSPHCLHQTIQVVTSIFSAVVFSNTAVLVLKHILPRCCIDKFEKYTFTFSKRDKSKKIYIF